MAEYDFVIHGEPASKANSRRLVRNKETGKLMSIKSAKALGYAQAAALQAPRLMLEGDLSFTATLYYSSRRPDLDASVLLDALEGRCYANDRQIKALHLIRAIDEKYPRSEITLTELENDDQTAV